MGLGVAPPRVLLADYPPDHDLDHADQEKELLPDTARVRQDVVTVEGKGLPPRNERLRAWDKPYSSSEFSPGVRKKKRTSLESVTVATTFRNRNKAKSVRRLPKSLKPG